MMGFKSLSHRRDSPIPPLSKQIYEPLPASTDPLRTPHTPSFCLPLHLRDNSPASASCSPEACVEVGVDPPALCSPWDVEGLEERREADLQPTVSTDDYPRHTTSCSQPDFLSTPTPEEHSGCNSPGFTEDSPSSATHKEDLEDSSTSCLCDQDNAIVFSGAFAAGADEAFGAKFKAEGFSGDPLSPAILADAYLSPTAVHCDAYVHPSSPFCDSGADRDVVASPLSREEGFLDSIGVDSLEEDIALLYAAMEGREKEAPPPVLSSFPSISLYPVDTPTKEPPCFFPAAQSPSREPPTADRTRSRVKSWRGLRKAARLGMRLLHTALRLEEKVLRRLCSNNIRGSSSYGSDVQLLSSRESAAGAASVTEGATFSAPLWGPLEGRWRQSQRWVCWGEALGTFFLTLVLFASALSASPAMQSRDAPRFLHLLLLNGRLPLLFYVVAAATGWYLNLLLL